MYTNTDALPLGKILQPKQGSGRVKKIRKGGCPPPPDKPKK